MRVISGSARGRRLRTLSGLSIRPTSDKLRGAIFNILASRTDLAGLRVLDAFAGSGALGIEALSRGASEATFLENDARAESVVRANLHACGFDNASIVHGDAIRSIARLGRENCRFDCVFLDPPYERGFVGRTLAAIVESGVLAESAWVVVEHHIDESPIADGAFLELINTRRYGKSALTLLRTPETMKRGQDNSFSPVRAVYAGSFDPITNGHLDVIHRALNVFDEVIVAVANTTSDPKKSGSLFTAEERVEMITEVLADTGGRARADSFTGLLVDYCDRVGARVSIRGLRAVSDFEYEFQMAMMNRHMKPNIETVFMAASETHFYTSSRLMKEVARLGGDVRGLLPDSVIARLHEKLTR